MIYAIVEGNFIFKGIYCRNNSILCLKRGKLNLKQC